MPVAEAAPDGAFEGALPAAGALPDGAFVGALLVAEFELGVVAVGARVVAAAAACGFAPLAPVAVDMEAGPVGELVRTFVAGAAGGLALVTGAAGALAFAGAGAGALALASTAGGGLTPRECTRACLDVSSSESRSSIPVTRALISTNWPR